jgi:hypothetical protein
MQETTHLPRQSISDRTRATDATADNSMSGVQPLNRPD